MQINSKLPAIMDGYLQLLLFVQEGGEHMVTKTVEGARIPELHSGVMEESDDFDEPLEDFREYME